jgi:folate-binding protein YgfZ
MASLPLHEFHAGLNAVFTEVNGQEAVAHHGDPLAEHGALGQAAGVLDLSFRSRLCLAGDDRIAFLHGQVTNDVKGLRVGEGCYAALVNARGRMQSDLNIFRLPDELLLDFEPGLAAAVSERLEKFVIAADVRIVDVSPHFGLLSVQGPKAAEVVRLLGLGAEPPERPMRWVSAAGSSLGEVYLVNQPRLGFAGFDLYVPVASLAALADKLLDAARRIGGRACGWEAMEIARVEAGLPRFGADMDERSLPPEAGLEARAISYTKGCYIGQEVLARIRTYGQVARTLRGLVLAADLPALPVKGDQLFKDSKEVGQVTSAVRSPRFGRNIALACVRREVNREGTELQLRHDSDESKARVVELPFG